MPAKVLGQFAQVRGKAALILRQSIFIGAIGALLVCAALADADIVLNRTLSLTLPPDNVLDVSVDLGMGPIPLNTTLSGSADVTFVFDDSENLLRFGFTGGSISGTDITVPFLATVTGLGATVDTPGGTEPVSGNTFDATLHVFTINSGTVNSSFGTVDLSTINPSGTGSGLGQISLTPMGSPSDYLASIVLPVSITETIPLGTGSAILELDGDVVMSGLVTVPEPSAAACISLCLIGGVLGHFWKQRNKSARVGLR